MMQHIATWIRRVVDEAGDDNTGYCVLLESIAAPTRWVQLTWDSVNAAYPFEDEPLNHLAVAGVRTYEGFGLIDWKAGSYATFDHSSDALDEIAAFVSDYLEKILEVGATEDALRVEEQQL